MGWVVMTALSVGVGTILWLRLRGDSGAVQFMLAALLVALAGYAWQGRPGLSGAPKAQEKGEQPDSPFAALRRPFMGEFNSGGAWLTLAEGYQRRGDTAAGAQLLKSALRREPNNADLWIGLGSALVQHAGGRMTPAAELAFERAARLAPDYPATRFFYGLALAQSGDLPRAQATWRALLARTPADATWRPLVEERLALVDRLRAMGIDAPPMRRRESAAGPQAVTPAEAITNQPQPSAPAGPLPTGQ